MSVRRLWYGSVVASWRSPLRTATRMRGVTLVEIAVVIAIIGIATAVALPSFTVWVVNDRIRNAAGNLQEDMQWARGYAVRTDQNVYMQVLTAGTSCTWAMSLNYSGTTLGTVIAGAPSMNLQPPVAPPAGSPSFSKLYPNTSCLAPVPNTLNNNNIVAFTPEGTILGTGSYAGQLATSAVFSFTSTTNAARYDTWLVTYYGAGEIRSCVAVPNSTLCAVQ